MSGGGKSARQLAARKPRAGSRPTDDYKPFRWDISKREQLPKAPPFDFGPFWPYFENELRGCAARVIAAAGDTDWVFVGRSPEHLFDYLSGIFAGMRDAPSLTLLLVSLSRFGWDGLDAAADEHPTAFAGLASYFATERLDPAAIAGYGKAVAFIDVVSGARTFGALVRLLKRGCRLHRIDWNAVQRRIRFIGLTEREKTSPKTWRWQQHQKWLADLPDARVRNVSVPYLAFAMMADRLAKLTPSHTLDRWALVRGGGPVRGEKQMAGLQMACRLYDLGRTRAERLALAAAIAKLPDMRDPWLRRLVLKLRRSSSRRKRPPGSGR